MTMQATDPVQAAVILPEPITKRLDQLVRLGVGESRESLVNEALDEYLIATERRLDKKRRALGLQGIQPGTQEWEDSFQQLEQIARTTHIINDEKMEYLASETISEIRKEE